MSIVAYTGLPRSGKSYGVVEHQIVPALKAGRKVVTNLAMIPDVVADQGWPGELVLVSTEVLGANPDKLYDYVTPGCVFIVDELWKILPQGMTALNCPETWKRLFAEHGHMVDAQNNGTQVVLVVQDLANVAPFARRLVENTFVSHKLGHLGLNRSYRVDVYYGAVTGCTPNVNKRLRFIAGSYKKEIYKLYKSQTMSEASGGHGDESKVDGRANVFKRPIVIVGFIFAPLAIGWGLWQFNKAFHGMAEPNAKAHPKAQEGDAVAQRSGATAAPPVPQVGRRASDGRDIRVLLEIQDAKHPEKAGVYMADGPRLLHFDESECRHLEGRLECMYRGAYYDAAGYVAPVPQPPRTAPVNLAATTAAPSSLGSPPQASRSP